MVRDQAGQAQPTLPVAARAPDLKAVDLPDQLAQQQRPAVAHPSGFRFTAARGDCQ
jgi:hypothetical protein